MSRQKLKARGKTIQKMSRDGVVQINAVTGDEQSISKREADFELKGGTPEPLTLSQVGTRLDGKSTSINERSNSKKIFATAYRILTKTRSHAAEKHRRQSRCSKKILNSRTIRPEHHNI